MRILVICALVLVLIAGCGRGGNDGAGRANVLRYALQEEPTALDPALNEAFTTGELLQNIYEGLVILDRNSKPAPGIAEKWEVSADGKTWTFHLRANAKFHSPYNRPVTAADVKYSYERDLWPETKSPIAGPILIDIEGAAEVLAGKRRDLPGMRAIDSRTLQITLVRPCGYFLVSPATTFVVCKEAIERSGGSIDEKSSIGSGPFVLKEYRHGTRVVLESNPDYWNGKPPVDRIERPIVIDPDTAHIKYENDELDFLWDSVKDFAQDKNNSKLSGQCVSVPFASPGYVAMNARQQPEFGDIRVRRAIAMVIDRDEIVRVAYSGVVQPAGGFLPSGALGYDPNIRKVPHDPAAARKLLAEAGFPDGNGFPAVTLYYVQKNPQVEATAQLIRDYLKKELTISVNLQSREAATFYSDTGKGKLSFYLEGWVALDPRDFLSFLFRTGARYNALKFSDTEFDRLCDLGDQEMDENKRASYYRQADQILLDKLPVIPFIYSRGLYLQKPWVSGIQYFLNGPLPHYTTRVSR